MKDENTATQADIDALWRNQTTAQHGIALCRAALAAAKTRCCPHGGGWRNCHQHDGHVVAGEVTKETE